MGYRILVAGFQHETNTFGPSKAGWPYFENGEMFPAFSRGPEMLARHRGRALPISGFIEGALAREWRLLPSCWAGGGASAQILQPVYDKIAGMILDDVARAVRSGIDGVYLDLHGAAVTEEIDDPEGDLLDRIRVLVGPKIPIVASLDLHANVSEEMLSAADALVCYRTYPHIDMHETGLRAANLMLRLLKMPGRDPKQTIRVPFLIPLNLQDTTSDPASSVYKLLVQLEREYDVTLNFAMGFPAADIPACGPRVWGYGASAKTAVERLFEYIEAPRSRWRLGLLAPNDAVLEALRLSDSALGPIVIADTQDNPGAGGDSNTTGMLRALIGEKAGLRYPSGVALGLLYDPQAAEAAHKAGVGAQLDLVLGTAVPTYTGEKSDDPLPVRCTVRSLGDGKVELKGPMSMGGLVTLGPCACLEVSGVLVLVSSGKMQLLDREIYRHLGVMPEDMKILVNKSSVHFRADFAPIASAILVAQAKGPVAANPADLTWTKLPVHIARQP
jgi:microcystin degradation protein MlrC